MPPLSFPHAGTLTAIGAGLAAQLGASPLVAQVAQVAPAAFAGTAPAAPASILPSADAARPAPAALPVAAAPTRWARVTVAAEWAHLGAGPVVRPGRPYTAVRSMAGALSLPLGNADRSVPRIDLGWVRAVRSANTAQGATLGASLPITAPGLGGRVRLVPGVAAAAGWAEAQSAYGEYAWRGAAGTSAAGQTGTQVLPTIVRSRMTGVGAHVAAEASLDGLLGRESRGVALAGSVRRWAFRGRAAEPNRRVTLVGLGVAVRPSALVAQGGAR